MPRRRTSASQGYPYQSAYGSGGGYGPYDGDYSPGSSDRIANLYAQRAQQAYAHRMNMGDLLAGGIQNLGAGLGNYFQQRDETRAVQSQAARARATAEEAKAKEAARAQDLAAFLEGGTWSDPKVALAESVRRLGPKEGVAFAAGLKDWIKLKEKKDPKDALARLPGIARGILALPEGQRPLVWGPAVAALEEAGIGREGELPQEYDPQRSPALLEFALNSGNRPTQLIAENGKRRLIFTDQPGQEFAAEAPPKSAWGHAFVGPDGVSYQENAQTGETRRTPGVGAKPTEPKGGIPETIVQDIGRLPEDWRDWNASLVTRDAFSVRNNEQAHAIATANASGKILPTKKQGEIIETAKATLSDIAQAEQLLADPEVARAVGAYAGKMTNFLAKGWADPFGGEAAVSPKVRQFRATINRLGAEERHRIFGAALTAIESRWASGFIPEMTQSGATVGASLAAFRGDIERGMDAMWRRKVGGARPTPGGGRSRISSATEIKD